MKSQPAFAALAAILAAAGLLTGCSSTQNSAPAKDAFAPGIEEPTTVSLWYTYPTLFDGTIASIVKTCEAKVKNLTIDAQSVGADYNELNHRAQTAIASGNGPDITLEGIGNVEPLSDLPAVNNLTDLVDNGSDFAGLDSFLPLAKAGNGVQVGVPYAVSAPVLYWNREHFKAAGLDPDKPPTTIEELLADAAKLANPATGRVGLSIDYALSNNFSVPTIMANSGATVVKDGKPEFASDKSIELLAKLSKGVKDKSVGVYADNSQSTQAFDTQQSSMHIGSIASLPQRLKSLGPIFSTTKVPHAADYSGAYTAFGSGAMWVMYSHSDAKRRAAAEALRCFAGPEATKLPFINSGYLPGSTSALKDPDVQKLLQEQPARQAGIDAMKSLAKLPAFGGRDGARAADAFRDSWVLGFAGQKNPADALNEAKAEIEALNVK
ncbi:extracellular solute-binding protein [Arthrobacter sp. alpha11c]